MGLLSGKVALITGAARGIGKAIALKYASEGADIAFTDLVINETAEQTVKEIEAFGVKAKAYASNAASFEETHKVVEEIHKEFGKIDILVNNAGITKDGLMLRMSEAQWDAVINVNLKSAFNFIHAITPIMARQKGGSIINMSSVVGVSGNAGQCNYSASKAGLIGLAKSIAKEMGFNGMRVHQKVDDPWLYYYADTLGFYVWAETPGAYAFGPPTTKSILNLQADIVKRVYNHPSVIAYVPFNESWGVKERRIWNFRISSGFTIILNTATSSRRNSRT